MGERTAPEHHSEEGRWKTSEEQGKKKKREKTIYMYKHGGQQRQHFVLWS